MKTKYKYIYFEEVGVAGETVYLCYNNKSHSILGEIKYYPAWKQYVIEFEEGCVFNDSCLNDIADFLANLIKEETGKSRPKVLVTFEKKVGK